MAEEKVVETVDERPVVVEPQRSNGLVAAIVILALILTIGWYFVTLDRHEDNKAAAITGAAQSVGDAAGNAADKLSK